MSHTIGGTQLITADGVVGTSGTPIRVYSVHIISGGGGAAVVAFKNGTTAGATTYASVTGVTSAGASQTFGTTGMFFPSGCFVDVDANTTSVAVQYVQ